MFITALAYVNYCSIIVSVTKKTKTFKVNNLLFPKCPNKQVGTSQLAPMVDSSRHQPFNWWSKILTTYRLSCIYTNKKI